MIKELAPEPGMLRPREKVDPEVIVAFEASLVVDQVGIGDDLRHVSGLKVNTFEALLHFLLELHEIVDASGHGEHREHLPGRRGAPARRFPRALSSLEGPRTYHSCEHFVEPGASPRGDDLRIGNDDN